MNHKLNRFLKEFFASTCCALASTALFNFPCPAYAGSVGQQSAGVQALVNEVRSPRDNQEKTHALRELANVSPKSPGDLQSLFSLADEMKKDPATSHAISESLQKMPTVLNAEDRRELIAYLDKGNNDIVIANSAAIAGKARLVEAVEPLKRVVSRVHRRSKEDYQALLTLHATGEALGKIGDKSSLDYLVSILPNDDRVAAGIAAFGVEGINAVVPGRVRGFEAVIVQERDPRAEGILLGLLNDQSDVVRRVAATALRNYPPDAQVASTLRQHLSTEKHDWTRSELIKGLAHHGGPQEVPFLTGLAKSEKSYAAIEALRMVGDSSARVALLSLEKDPLLKGWAAGAIRSIDKKASRF